MRNRIKERREKLGLNRVQVAAASGLSFQSIINHEAALQTPNLDTARRIAAALKTTVDDLWPQVGA